jgi:fructose-1,6-bisphosphatase II
VTEAAAIASYDQVGRGNEHNADQAAVDAMRRALNQCNFDGTVVIGEGERDEAPMLFIGEKVGTGRGPKVDIALDPLEGTTLTAKAMANALAVVAVAEGGSLLHAPDTYMDKIAIGGGYPDGIVDLDADPRDNILALAKAKGKHVGEILVAVLDRPRHEGIIQEIRDAGAGTRLLLDGDVAGGINAARYESRIDMCIGIGGSPEGIVTACAIKALGGFIQGRLAPKDDDEAQGGIDAGLKMDYVYEANELVNSDNTFFVATGVTDGAMVEGVRRKGPIIRTDSFVLRSKSGTIRRVQADYLAERWA